MSSCCGATDADAHPCPECVHVGPNVGVAPVRPHLADGAAGDWQYCANEACKIIYYLDHATVDADSVIARVGSKAADKTMPVCFCFAHTADALERDLAEHDGVSQIKAKIKTAVADSLCACEYLNPSGSCCLADVHHLLKRIAGASPS